jgi:hypothetical protein
MQSRLKEIPFEPVSEPDLDPGLRARLASLHEEGQEWWNRFDREVRQQEWHPFVPADYASVLRTLLSLREPGLRFLEWGSATGIITITADLLGFEAYGIEIDADLVASARIMATRFNSNARFAAGSYLPAGYQWRSPRGDRRLGTIGVAESAYPELGHPLDDFDIVFGYPWDGEEPIMLDLMQQYGGAGARLLIQGTAGARVFRRGGAQV